MKKSLIALALAGAFVGGAQAQSSVTLYGIVDASLQYNTFGVNRGTTAAPNWQQESAWGINSGYQSGSRLGFRGSEMLSKEWSAVFTLEAGFNVDTGTSAQNGQLFGRQAFVGLQHQAFGTFVLGRIATPSSGTGAFDLFGSVDPFSTGWGVASLGSTFIPSATLREDNAILWASPTWAGFKLAAAWSGRVLGAETAPQGDNTSAMNLGANWTWGPLFLAATYDVISYGNAPAGTTPCSGSTPLGCQDQKMLQIGGTWDFKLVKIHAAYADQSNISAAQSVEGVPTGGSLGAGGFIPTGIGNWNNTAWMLGASVPLFGGKLLASYQYSDADNIRRGTASYEPDYSNWGIGYEYPFSRRTNMYVGYAQRSWDGKINYAPGVVVPNVVNFFNKDQFAVGIRHLF